MGVAEPHNAAMSPVPPATSSPRAEIDVAAARARAYFTSLGLGPSEGNGPVELRYVPESRDAAYRAKLLLAPDGSATRQEEHVEIGHDPFTGQSFSRSPDVVFHELAHRVNDHAVPGFGTNPTSRIVDESLADTFAAAIDGNWTIGEGVVPGGLRSMSDPGSQLMLDGGKRVRVQTPTRIEEITPGSMQRGPYFNIGPVNHAAYLVGTSVGTETMARIYLQALRRHLRPASAITDLVLGTIRGAGELYGNGSREQAAVRDAWKAVGVRAAAVDAA